MSPEEVRRSLQCINSRKAAGLNNVLGQVLRDCTQKLTGVGTDIFNTSLSHAVMSVCLKMSTIIPVLKSSAAACMNDCPLVALTLIVMKCSEHLVMAHIKDTTDINMDPHQKDQKNWSVSDAVSSVIHSALTHLKSKDSYVRLHFLDSSSAFNTIIPQTLVKKVLLLGLTLPLCNWVLDFLMNRPQTVKIHEVSSSPITLNTGLPQGCVLSPLLYTLLT